MDDVSRLDRNWLASLGATIGALLGSRDATGLSLLASQGRPRNHIAR
jgi:hypothetical protein